MSFEKTGYKGISQELKIENVLYNQILIDNKNNGDSHGLREWFRRSNTH